MIYILLIVIIVILLLKDKRTSNIIKAHQYDMLHLYAMLALIPRKFYSKAQKDFYIKIYQREAPMFYSADFEISIDVEKFLQSEDTKDFTKEYKDKILNAFKKSDRVKGYTCGNIKMSNDPHIKQCHYIHDDSFGIPLRVDVNKNEIKIRHIGISKYFDFQKWINLEMCYQRYLQWQEDTKNYPAWHIEEKKVTEWEGWKIEHFGEGSFKAIFFDNDYITICPTLAVWDKCGRNIAKDNIEWYLPTPLDEDD